MLQKGTWMQNPKGKSIVHSTCKNVPVEKVYFFELGKKEMKIGKKLKHL